MPQKTVKTLLLYWSATGNTEKVAKTIQSALIQNGITPEIKKVAEAMDTELYDYDLVILGAPAYQFLPPEPVLHFVKQQMKVHNEREDIKPGAPRRPGKTAAIFCTYSGPHTGIREATPVGDYLGQFFEHLGFAVSAQWYIIGEFHGREDLNTRGRLGDIRGRPNAQDLAEVEKNVRLLVNSLKLDLSGVH